MRYQIIGTIALVHDEKDIKEILKRHNKITSIAVLKRIKGAYREPEVEIVWGSKNLETIHKENEVLYKLDAGKIMFSKGNMFERHRIIPKKSETVLDMFAGIGYFTLPIAKKVKKVYAVEKNPLAFKYLKENIELNKLNNVVAINDDCRNTELNEKVDRVLMGFFSENENTQVFLPKAFSCIKSRAWIHYHNAYREYDLNNPEKELQEEAELHGFRILKIKKRKVKSIAPKTWHVITDTLVLRQINYKA
ncbi:MAG: methyltransferase [Candidatus Aenigmarchaeota archaeon]|nr:methyltransferase [Candidatus Aenigmarchaeota archaeon]